MKKQINIGAQNFGDLVNTDAFYIDKTMFIKEWWENLDVVTLIARPRRFGKTLNMSMMDYFFSNKYAREKSLFDGLNIAKDENMMVLQGTYPVISMTFSDIKENNFQAVIERLKVMMSIIFNGHRQVLSGDCLSESEKKIFEQICDMSASLELLKTSVQLLSDYLHRYYGKKVIILLDEYDTPLQEAYVDGYWDEMTSFIRGMFNSTFKANTHLERALLTGITRVSKESIFSDLNNLAVVTISSEQYASSFGFTQEEVDESLVYYGLEDKMEEVRKWYNGFLFGDNTVIYNPWSMINYLKEKKFKPYWANTSSNSLIGKLMRQGDEEIKQKIFDLMKGNSIKVQIDEQIVFNQLDYNEEAIWSLMVATGYLKILNIENIDQYELMLTNYEVRFMFRNMIKSWFDRSASKYNRFVASLMKDDLKTMNIYMNEVALNTFSFFDSGTHPSNRSEPERFYHGFVLGLMVDLEEQYSITSNRESGYGRYDIMLEPKEAGYDGIIMEFKVLDSTEETTLEDTAKSALAQIEEKQYEATLREKGVERIRKYGLCFEGKNVLIVKG